jgi:hypothetical protein
MIAGELFELTKTSASAVKLRVNSASSNEAPDCWEYIILADVCRSWEATNVWSAKMRDLIPKGAIEGTNTAIYTIFGQIEERGQIIARWDALDLEYLDKLLPSGMPTKTHL